MSHSVEPDADASHSAVPHSAAPLSDAPHSDAPQDPAPAVAIIGGGQLARMMAQAAVGLGVPLRLLAEMPSASAAQVVPATLVGDHRNLDDLRAVAKDCAVVTFDHEHVPPQHLEALSLDGHACHPGPAALLHAQDKGVMRARLDELGIASPRHRLVENPRDVEEFAASIGGFPVVLKSTRGGYDGKGVWFVREQPEVEAAFAAAERAGAQVLVEEQVPFRRELAALVARSPSGQVAAYPVVESVQRDGVCHEVIAPAPDLDEELALQAQRVAMQVADELDVVGILAVELFETRDGRVLVNELAMRPHNTGHWSIDGAVTSQFENHLRAVLDLPLGAPRARAPWTVMVNILGSRRTDPPAELYPGYRHVYARDPELKVHLYGKTVRPGRKVGHVTAFGEDLAEVRARAQHAAAWFADEITDEEEAG